MEATASTGAARFTKIAKVLVRDVVLSAPVRVATVMAIFNVAVLWLRFDDNIDLLSVFTSVFYVSLIYGTLLVLITMLRRSIPRRGTTLSSVQLSWRQCLYIEFSDWMAVMACFSLFYPEKATSVWTRPDLWLSSMLIAAILIEGMRLLVRMTWFMLRVHNEERAAA